jgi:small nuclear ribonucleoprotein (snRNP)-like protein
MKKYEELRQQRLERIGEDKLSKLVKKKIETTMIGSLSAFEKHFAEILEESEELQDLYNRARSEILDKGNYQLRNIDSDFKNFIVKEKLRHYEFRTTDTQEDHQND